jgi:Protein of unknown function (DUF4019)
MNPKIRIPRSAGRPPVPKLTLVLALALALGAAIARPSRADENGEVQAAIEAARSWLEEVDAGAYGASWDHAAELFRKAITREGWESALHSARSPLGTVQGRALKSSQYATELPGAPDGEYVVLQFETSFANKKNAIETVTPMKDPDGKWRVSGYYVR